jgi:hypothetical protein
MERRAVELDTGARELGREHVTKVRLSASVIIRSVKVNRSELGYGYTSLWFSIYSGQITIYVDRAADGLYRMKQTYGSPLKVQTTNYADWPELKELYEFLEVHCRKQEAVNE